MSFGYFAAGEPTRQRSRTVTYRNTGTVTTTLTDLPWDEAFLTIRADAYKKMTQLFLEHFPWIPVIQPFEDNGLQKYVEWNPDPLQQLEIRRFNLKFRRA